ncbi:MAG: CDP-glycerol:poly(glycerophosphate) glycerophosphotransferase, partial [uncultured Solirubrobacteraceae bacterium]
ARPGRLPQLARPVLRLPAGHLRRAAAAGVERAPGLGARGGHPGGPGRDRARRARHPGGVRGAGRGAVGRLERHADHGLAQAPGLLLPADLARDAAQAAGLRHPLGPVLGGAGALRRRAATRRGQVRRDALGQPVQHARPAAVVPLPGPHARDGLSPQRRPPRPRTRRRARAGAGGARPGRHAGRPLRPDLAGHVPAHAGRPRPGPPAPRARGRDHPAPARPRLHGGVRAGRRRARGAQRDPVAGHRGALPRGRRRHHGLLVLHVRRGGDGDAAAVLHLRLRALPGRHPGLQPPVRGGGARPAPAHLRRGGGRPGRPRGGHRPVPRALRRVGRPLLPVGRRRRLGPRGGRGVRDGRARAGRHVRARPGSCGI